MVMEHYMWLELCVDQTERKQTLSRYHTMFPTRKGHGNHSYLVLTVRWLGDRSVMAQWETQHKIQRPHPIATGECFPQPGTCPREGSLSQLTAVLKMALTKTIRGRAVMQLTWDEKLDLGGLKNSRWVR